MAKVVKNGAGASKFAAGQRVVAAQWPQFSTGGTWTTHAVVQEDILVRVLHAIIISVPGMMD